MDIIITALAEFIWATSCAVVNFCLSSGVSVLAVFVSFLCAILASAFYKYTASREQMSVNDASYSLVNQDDDDDNKTITTTSTTDSSIEPSSSLPLTTIDDSNNVNTIESLSEIEICVEEETNENDEIANDFIIETIEGSEEEIQKQQIANIYRLLNDQHLINNWTTTDFFDQLKMYGLEEYDENQPDSS